MNRTLLIYGLSFIFLATLTLLALSVGVAGFGWGDHNTLLILRAPRVVAALTAGLALGMGGGAQQGLFRNPLADPGLTGVFGGALAGIAILLCLQPETAWRQTSLLPLAAFGGAILASVILVALSNHKNPSRLLLTGLGINAFTASVVLVLANLSPTSREVLTNGAYGDWLGLAAFRITWLPCTLCVLASLLLLRFSSAWDYLSFGPEVAQSLGVPLLRTQRWSILLTALAAAAATCLVGQIAFIGLLAPHLARTLVGPRHRIMLPLAGCLGALLLLGADTAGRTLWPETPLSAAGVMAILGAPIFIWIARQNHA
jgi:iron complex transport system permease protein